ncbi:MAG: PepSY domain-containing protein [Bacteroidota bacterium]
MKKVKTYRKLHRFLVPFFVIFFLLVSLSGLILAWKKNSAGILLPQTEDGLSSDMQKWLPMDSLNFVAVQCLKDSVSNELSTELSKIDLRPKKGVAKFIFENHYYEVQVDCASGKVLSLKKRNADWIEAIHDGSIIDRIFSIKGDPVKVIYSSTLSLAALFMTYTGFFIWNKRRKKVKMKGSLK